MKNLELGNLQQLHTLLIRSHRTLIRINKNKKAQKNFNRPVSIRRCIEPRTVQHFVMVFQHRVQPCFEVVDLPYKVAHTITQQHVVVLLHLGDGERGELLRNVRDHYVLLAISLFEDYYSFVECSGNKGQEEFSSFIKLRFIAISTLFIISIFFFIFLKPSLIRIVATYYNVPS